MSRLADKKCWMSQNFIQLNEAKSEILLFGSPNAISSMQSHLGGLSTNVKSTARNLGVIFNLVSLLMAK